MIIILQYTLTDIRRFDNHFSLLKVPKWPLPEVYKEFVRGNGQIVPSTHNTISTHLGKTSITESFICKIKKGVKTQKVIHLAETNLKNKINHYFSDGGVLSKYEFIFETSKRDLHYNYKTLKKIVNEILETTVHLRNKDFKYSTYKFKTILNGLKELLLISTTEKKYFNDHHESSIIRCTPQIFITLNKDESFLHKSKKELPITINDSYDSILYGWWEKYNNNPYKFWVIKNCGPLKNESLNTLRTGILRIHSEKECINNVIQALLTGKLETPPNTQESDFLQSFLNDKIKDIGTDFKKINTLDSSAEKIESFIKEAFEKFNPGEVSLLSNKMKQLKLRPQVENKIVNYFVKNALLIEKQTIMDNSQSISFGDNANFQGNINQTIQSGNNPDFDFKTVYDNIALLIEKVSMEKASFEKDVALENLEAAKNATIKKDSAGVVGSLKKIGSWAMEFATQIGANVIAELAKQKLQ